jgi:hypothetical protein
METNEEVRSFRANSRAFAVRPSQRGLRRYDWRVDLSNYLQMNPHLLLGLVNTELRNHCDSLEDLVKTHHLDEAKFVARLAEAGYTYQPAQNQFR